MENLNYTVNLMLNELVGKLIDHPASQIVPGAVSIIRDARGNVKITYRVVHFLPYDSK